MVTAMETEEETTRLTQACEEAEVGLFCVVLFCSFVFCGGAAQAACKQNLVRPVRQAANEVLRQRLANIERSDDRGAVLRARLERLATVLTSSLATWFL